MITINGIYRPISAAINASPSTPAPVEDTEKSVFGAQLKQVADSLATPTPIKTEQSRSVEAQVDHQESNASTAPVTVTAQTTGISSAVKNFMEWQSAQPNPFGQGTIADVWAKQGITDPMNNLILISQAQDQISLAAQRSAMNPTYVAEWSGDWKAKIAEAKSTEAQRQSNMIAAAAHGKLTVVGGGIISMNG
jgi:hypothetical protein